ncbi:MAG TPA: hypothetical protein VGI39_18710 [Polyangiaceae bacterium]
MPKVRGSALLTRVAYVKDKWGEDGWKRVHAALSAATKQILAGHITPREWHPFDAFVDLNVRIDSLFGKGDYRLCYEIGAYGAEKNMSTIYKVFIRIGSLTFNLEKAASLWNEHYDAGRLVTKNENGFVTLRIEDFPTPHCSHCFSVLGWAGKCAEMSGSKLLDKQRTGCRNWREGACIMSLRTA